MQNGQGVDPDPPAAVLELHGVVQQHPEEWHDHVGDLLLLVVARVDVRHGEEPVLPHRHLQHRPASHKGCTVHWQSLSHTTEHFLWLIISNFYVVQTKSLTKQNTWLRKISNWNFHEFLFLSFAGFTTQRKVILLSYTPDDKLNRTTIFERKRTKQN